MCTDGFWIRFGVISAVASVALYASVTVLGASLRPDYSHIRDSVSELIEIGAPNKVLLDTMMGAYHLLLIPFAYALHLGLPRTQRGWLGPTLIGVVGVIGIIITAFFPCDVGCEANPITIAGKGHGVLVAITALLVFIAMVAIYSRTREHASWNPYARYTLVTALLSLGLGLAALTLLNTDYTGLAERVGLLPIFLWFIVSALQVWRSIPEGPDAYANQI